MAWQRRLQTSPCHAPTKTMQNIHKASALELEFIAHRIGEALRHYPEKADNITQTRWEHGLGRELVRSLLTAIVDMRTDKAHATYRPGSGLPSVPLESQRRIPLGSRTPPPKIIYQ